MLSKLSKNLGLRIQLTLTLLVLLTAVPIGLLWYHSSEQVRLQTVEKLYRHSSETIYNQLDSFFSEAKIVYQHQQRIEKDLPDIVQDRDRLIAHLANVLNHHFNIDYFYFANTEGGLVSLGHDWDRHFIRLESDDSSAGMLTSYEAQYDGKGGNITAQAENFDARNRQWYQSALKSEQPVWSDIYSGAIDHNLLGITLSKALRDEKNQVIGVWGLDITLTSVAKELIKAKPSENSTVALVNEKGQILASSNPQHSPKQGMLVTVNSSQAHALGKLWKLIKPHANQSRNEQAHDVTQTFQFQGQSWLSYHTQYPLSKSRQMRIVIYSPVSDLTQDFLQAKHYAIIITVLMIVLAAYYGAIGTQYTLTPIRQLTKIAEEISQGKWNKKITVERDDEVGQLAKSFNKMTTHLESTIHQLDQQQQETKRLNALLEEQNSRLEERVKARTEELSQLNKRLRQLADIDPLTGIANRRLFWEQFENTIGDTHGWLLILDIDNFKQLNDSYGHITGNLALQHFAKLCQNCLSDNDYIGRIGGEEFAIWSESSSVKHVQQLTEHIFDTLKKSPLNIQGKPIFITTSIGGTNCFPGKLSCYAIADRMLYKAKQTGKNKAVIDTSLTRLT
ncbi:sensor domain-containing diguanylate cyclase [Photobacterium chitinilyticum]|uniref:diguanylate cyclase n=1 Tax=Photobacterium chitinilyticum TaxID=2485123 RepID=A0A3S3RJI4_9GAMM|nr:diguanylate cyclase [Photobacterium chitinilyticum]RWX57072.1 diguanylate cyclase [Photobacterium chitinilyticum]